MSQLKHKNYLQIQIALSKEDFDGFTVKALRNRLLQQNDEAMLYAKRPGNDSNLLIVFYVQIMPDDFVMQLHRF